MPPTRRGRSAADAGSGSAVASGPLRGSPAIRGHEIGGIAAEELATTYGTPLYVYDAGIMRDRLSRLRDAIHYEPTELYYSCKANSNPAILRLLRELGISGIDAASPGEARFALAAGFAPGAVSVTNPALSSEELSALHALGVRVKIDSLSQLKKWRALTEDEDGVWLRVNAGSGFGDHEHVVTAGPASKFGIYRHELDAARSIAGRVIGLHQHAGCGARDAATFVDAAEPVLALAAGLPDLEAINLGGGLGVPYRPEEEPLDVEEFGRRLSERLERFASSYGRRVTLILEPGRFLVAECGYLLARVRAVKETPVRKFAVVDTGFNHLIRPVLYGAYHGVVNVSNPNGKQEEIWVAGNVCEAGDLFTDSRRISGVREGDLLVLLDVGAYGYSMSSHYTGAARPAEVLVCEGGHRRIRDRQEPG